MKVLKPKFTKQEKLALEIYEENVGSPEIFFLENPSKIIFFDDYRYTLNLIRDSLLLIENAIKSENASISGALTAILIII